MCLIQRLVFCDQLALQQPTLGVVACHTCRQRPALRMIQALLEDRPFVMAFSGYSITVGRGNFFNQSFPFVTQRVLQEPLQRIMNTELIVRNGAIGGIPSYPYGFCLEHFLGTDPDVISWDYSMNEGGRDASVLEAFVRQATQQDLVPSRIPTRSQLRPRPN